MHEFDRLVEVIKTLRSPNGCQWDKEQTFDSIKPYLLEETYEVLESIIARDYDELQEELGDLLCQVVFLAQLANEENKFTIDAVVKGINDKLITRHPHVFGDIKTNDTKEILQNWEAIKKSEAKKKNRKSILDGIPKALPALARAYKTQEKAARVGFDWENISDVIDKLEEELEELRESIGTENQTHIEEELGDALFVMVNLASKFQIDPETALHKTINKFYNRFHHIETTLTQQGKEFKDVNLAEMDKIWDEAKKLEKPAS